MTLTFSVPSANTIAVFLLVVFCSVLSVRNYFLNQEIEQLSKNMGILAYATEEFVVAQKQLNVSQVEANRYMVGKIYAIEQYLLKKESAEQEHIKKELISNGIYIVHEGQLSPLFASETVAPIQRPYLHGTESP